MADHTLSPLDPLSLTSNMPFQSPSGQPVLNATLLGDAQDIPLNTSQHSSVPQSPQSSQALPTVPSAQALQPSFQPPPPGQLRVAQAITTRRDCRRSLPILFYTSHDGNAKYVYPFSRSLIGTVWHTPDQLNACTFHYCHEPDPIRFCARRADLPTEMVHMLVVSLEKNGGGASLDLSKLHTWQSDVKHPESKYTAGIPCTVCGVLHDVCLNDVLHLSGISNGLACHHLGHTCIHEEGDRGNTNSSSHQIGPTTHHTLNAPNPPSHSAFTPSFSQFPSVPSHQPQQQCYAANTSSAQPHFVSSQRPTHLSHRRDNFPQNTQTPSVWRQLDAYDTPPSHNYPQGYPQHQAPTRDNASFMPNYPSNDMQRTPSSVPQNTWQTPQHINNYTSFSNACDAPAPIPYNNTNTMGWQQPPGYTQPAYNPIGANNYVKHDNTPSMLHDEIIQPGEDLHVDPDVQLYDPRFVGSDASHMPHPSMLVRGRSLKSFSTHPPSLHERHEFQAMKFDNRLERLNTILSKKLSDKTIPSFKGDSDNVQLFSQWEASLLKHFYASNITNSAVRAWLAQNTFADAANIWWVAHQSRRPTLTLSWLQFRELIQTELVPSVEKGSANAAWADLTFDGNTESFFNRVRAMSLYHPLPPKELQIMASRPFGSLFVERVKGSAAQNGVRGLSVPQWEAMVRTYVKEQEAHPNFQVWGRSGLEPIHRSPNKLRTVFVPPHELYDDEPQIPDDVPNGMDEEEWVAHVAHLYSSLTPNQQGGRPLKIGKGPRPCFVCGSDAHSWVKCERKRKGKCGVCGSEHHYTRYCVQRFYPDPKLSSTTPTKPPLPTSRSVTTHALCEVANNFSQEETVAMKDQPDDVASSPQPRETPTPHDVDLVPIPENPTWPTIRQVNIEQAEDLALPSWLKHRMTDQGPRTRVGKPIIPIDNPSVTGQLHFTTTVEGIQAKMLYDPSASHCFMDWDWAHRHGIRMRPRPCSSLNMFQGTALGAIRWSYIANDFMLGDASYVWRFLIIKPAPADIVLGLDFILHHKPSFDPATLRLWPTSPAPNDSQSSKDEDVKTEPHQDRLENHWVSVCDVVQPRHINFASVVHLKHFAPFAHNDDSTTLLSVTADSFEEERQLQEFFKELDPELLSVVRRHEAVFAPPDKEPPTRDVKHVIDLVKDAVPIKRRPYPLPPHKLEAMKTQITELDRTGWIEPSTSPWGAPILFVPKKNGDLRMCVDFRDLNSVTVDDCFPLPRIEVMLHRASQATFFSKLDLASGFHQIEVAPDSRPLTAFRLPEPVNGSALWQWKVMPFGLRNAPPTFQRAMSQALNDLEFCAVVYIDDILIFSSDKTQHMHHLDLVFQALEKHQYHIRLPKCEFLKDEVEFLGHRLSKEGIKTQPQKVTALQGWQTPFTTTKQVKSFLGAVAWYQNYIAHFATLAAPLYALTSTRRRFEWTDVCEKSVRALKDALCRAPVLARWQQELDTRVITDASSIGVGAALEQRHEIGWRPISFWSRKLRDAELNYSATDLEWLAVVMSVTRVWHWLLEGKPFVICSDHKALERKLHKSMHDPPITDRQARWIESLTRFPYTFQWIKGINNTFADALSRNPTPSCHATVSVTHTLLAGLRKRLHLVASQDSSYVDLIQQAKEPTTDLNESEGLDYDAQGRIYVPNDDEIRTLLIAEAHDSPMAGHFGMDRTLELVQRRWHLKGIQRDVREYVKTYAICQRAKHSTAKPPGLLHPIIASRPWEVITLDFVSGLPPHPSTKVSQILVIVDKFTKYVLLEPCRSDVDSTQTATIFVRRVIGEHGIPSVVISDRGPQFAAAVWKTILQSLGSRVALATTHHPQTDGQSERIIQTLMRIIRAYVRDQSHTWVEMLPLFQFALNNAASAVTSYSPFQLIHGRDPVAPMNLRIDQPEDVPGGIELESNRRAVNWARNWWKARRRLCKFAQENLQCGARLMKRRYDAGRRKFQAEPGDLVLLSVKSHPAFGEARKLRLRFTGPYVIKGKVQDNAYELEGLPPNVPTTQNVSFLRLFFPSPPKFETRPETAKAVRPTSFRDHREWEVEGIIDDREVNKQRQYLVKWKDFEDPTWLRISQLQHCSELLRNYQHEKGLSLDFWSDSSSSPESESEEDEVNQVEEIPLQSARPPSQRIRDRREKEANPTKVFDWGE